MFFHLSVKRVQRVVGACIIAVTVLTLCIPMVPAWAESSPASLYVAPASGTFTIGSTFTVSVFVNSTENNINAIQAELQFPPDKLQVVNPTAGKSLVQIWISQPTFDNRLGIIRFQGAIPSPGINTNAGLISEVTFRVIGLGTAIVNFKDESKVLLNDGNGTNILGQMTSGVYHLVLPPPAGPTVTSPTHPDQETWYNNRTVALEWASYGTPPAYSYMLSDQPIDAPDDIPDGNRPSQTYQNLPDGIHYFHIKAFEANVWGGITHFVVHIDATAPADFPLTISPGNPTTVKRPTITFDTTDGLSGVTHYELRIIPLRPGESGTVPESAEDFFIEAQSPYVANLDYGVYDVVVRAYDAGGNYTQKSERLEIVTHIFEFFGSGGIRVSSNLIISWLWVIIVLLILLTVIAFVLWRMWRRHSELHGMLDSKKLPPEVQSQLDELKRLKDRYKQLSVILLAFVFGLEALLGSHPARAADDVVQLSPPLIDVVSKDITNEDIFYVGGVTKASGVEVVIYLQNIQDGGTVTHTVSADQHGRWFYSHPTFLSSGRYLLWTQARVGAIESPPSSQVGLTVAPMALQFGASRVSFGMVGTGIAGLLLLVLVALLILMVRFRRLVAQKEVHVRERVRQTEEVVRRGFATLHRDIEAQFKFMQRTKLTRTLSEEERDLEEKIHRDLQTVRGYIGEEMWKIEKDLSS